jgi:glycosyltransferase involved in cell wall biosynthesis
MTVPLVSVITTVFNGAGTLPATVESILNQELQDIEYIIVDDGSTDDTADWLAQLQDPRVKVIRIQRAGRGVALNVGLAHATSELIAILDADDIAAPGRLAIQENLMEQYDDYTVLACQCTPVLSALTKDLKTSVRPRTVDPREFIKNNAICHSGAMIRSAALQDVGNYDAGRTELFDYDLWLRFAAQGCRIGILDIPLVFKRLHKGQNFERKRRLNYLCSAYRCKQRALKLFPHSPFYRVYPIVTFLYGLLPICVRRLLMGCR